MVSQVDGSDGVHTSAVVYHKIAHLCFMSSAAAAAFVQVAPCHFES